VASDLHASRDTICAIATAPGGGIGVVRVSGPAALAIARQLLTPWPDEPASHRLYLTHARDPRTGERLDELLACVMRAPRSYTTDDVLELQGHGGAANVARLLDAAVRAGARVAEPGEFTRRAFLGGRIDLTRAEAVAELIHARSERAARLAQARLGGAVAERVEALRARLVEILAEVEGRVDFPEEDLDFQPPAEVARAAAALAGDVAALAATERRGRLVAEGIVVALVGRPNAGKSSLLNALAGDERVLVDAAPGTTRDPVEVEVALAGLPARIIDGAGEREEAGALERRGIELGRRRRAQADVVVLVVDGEVGLGDTERRLLAELAPARVLAWNKCDLADPRGLPSGDVVVATCATSGAGIDALAEAIRRAAGDEGDDGTVTVSSVRQRAALDEAVKALRDAEAALRSGAAPELAAVDLRVALERLGWITGAAVDGAVLDAIFARFCIGK
jgi:tRNA modification GTPase